MSAKQKQDLQDVWSNHIEGLIAEHGDDFIQALQDNLAAKTNGGTTCPAGSYWDTTTKSCQLNLG